MDHWDRIAAERRSLADLLDTLTPEQWAMPSLCGAWTVRDVAVHLSAGPATPTSMFLKAMVRARGLAAVGSAKLDGTALAKAAITVPDVPSGLAVPVTLKLDTTAVPAEGAFDVHARGTTWKV